MLVDVLTENGPIALLLVGCVIALAGLIIYRWQYNKNHYGIAFHIISFVLWSSVIYIFGCYANSVIADLRIRLITPGMVNFISASAIALMLLRKLFLMINVLEKQQVRKGSDITSARIVSRILKIAMVVVMVLLYGEHFGMSFSGLLTFGGIGGLAVGMAGKDILSNFFSGIMLYFDRPFNIGDWISSPDRKIEGTVVEIGWRLTKIITFDNRPLYVPNSVFTSISVENPGRMTNRRITTTLTLRYEDSDKIAPVVEDIRQLLRNDSDIDQQQSLLVNFNGFGDSSLNIMVYCFTKTTHWSQWLDIQQRVFLQMIDIVHRHGADFAFPSRTLYMEQDSGSLLPVEPKPLS